MTTPIRSRRPAFLIYIFATAALGLALMATSCYRVFREGLDPRWLVLAVLTAIVAFFTLKIPGIRSKISVADTLVMMNMIFFGPAAACLAAALEACAGSVLSATKSRRLEFTVFNMGNTAICAYVAGLMYWVVPGYSPQAHSPQISFAPLFCAATVMALSYYLLNSGTVALMLALESRKNVFRIWKKSFFWNWTNYLISGAAAAFIIVNGVLISPLTLMAAGFVVMMIYEAHKLLLGRLMLTQNG